MPELTLEIGERLYEVACEAGQEASLEHAARLLDAEAKKIGDSAGQTTEKRMLLLAGLLLADSMTTIEQRLAAAEERLQAAEERVRIAEAKSAMLAANALKRETDTGRGTGEDELSQLREENAAALDLLSRILEEVNAMADAAEATTSG